MISSKLRTYLDHLRWDQKENILFKVVNDVSFYSLQSALASVSTHRNVKQAVTKSETGTWDWHVGLARGTGTWDWHVGLGLGDVERGT